MFVGVIRHQKHFNMKTLFRLLIVAIAFSTSVIAKAHRAVEADNLSKTETDESVIHILTIGNSFSQDAVESYLDQLTREAGIKVVIGEAIYGGYSLKRHWDDAVNGINSLQYSRIDNGIYTSINNQTLSTILADEAWDYVTFQQVSQYSGMPDTFEPYLGNLINFVDSICPNPNVKLGYHMTWAYAQSTNHSGFQNYGCDQMTMYEAILSATQTALANHPELSFVIPSGTTIQNARTSCLGDDLTRDGFHLDIGIGRYIVACTWLETIFGVNPMDITYRPSSFDETSASIGRKAAHAAVEAPFTLTNLSTGIEAPVNNNDNALIFNLYGQQLQKVQRGINIIGGKKVLVR